MTLTAWADAIGEKCTPQKICNYEGGEDQVPIRYAARACILVPGVSFDYIYRGMTDHMPRSLLRRIEAIEAGNDKPRNNHRA